MDSTKSRALVFTSLAHFVNDGSTFFVPLVTDLLAASKGFSPTEVAIALFVFYALSTVPSLYIGRLADRSGEVGKMVSVGIALLGLGLLGFVYALFSTSGTLVLILAVVLCALMGIGSAFYHPLGATILQEAFSSSSRGRALGANGALGSIGRALYPSLFFVAAITFTQTGAMAVLGVLGLIAGAIIWMGLSGFRTKSRENDPRSGHELLTPAIVALSILTFLRTASMFGVAAWIPEYLTFQKGLGVSAGLGFTLSAMFAIAIVGQPLFGLLLDRYDRRLIFLLSSVGAGISVLAVTFEGGALALALLVSFGFFIYTGFPIVLSLASDYVPKGSEAMGNSLIWGLGQNGGNAAGSLLIGAIVLNDFGRLDLAFRIMAAVAVVSAFFILLVPKRVRKVIGEDQMDEGAQSLSFSGS